MYQALYRKWRPKTFDDVVGQKHVTETLKNQVNTGRLSHAYIFIGTRGTGKTTCARILAKAVNCEHPVNGNPCGCCASCRGIADGTVLDIVEMDAASNNSVDDVRALRDEAIFSPATAVKRVYIIDEVHMMSKSAFNALLKILEEPPEHLMFILATTELQKVPATILSRCQRHTFKRIESDMLADYVEYVAGKEGFNIKKDGAELIARLAEGGVRDALSLLDQCSACPVINADAVYDAMGLAGNKRIAELLHMILDGDLPSSLRQFNTMWMDGKDPKSVLTELSTLLRDVLMMRVAPKGCRDIISGGYDINTLNEFAQRLSAEEIASALDELQSAAAAMRDTQSPKTTGEICIVSLCCGSGKGEKALVGRVAKLEAKLRGGFVPAVSAPQPAVQHGIAEKYVVPERPAPRETVCESEPDEIDPAEFAEEQPEDIVFAGRPRTVTEPARNLAEPPIQPQPQMYDLQADSADIWETIRTDEVIPNDIRRFISNSGNAYGVISGDVLKIYAESFIYGRLNKPAVMAAFEKAAASAAGRRLCVQLADMPQEKRESRDLEQLGQFPEVKIIK